mmetsp:Transcript_41264/g.124793  ORF Transcript_41264/g.124793 Transcript_41264/m.124793 type:complete len:207 (+) Transcript_41264:1448-2068(+)
MTSVSRSDRGVPPPASSVLVKSSNPCSPSGSMLNALPLITSMGGRSWWRALAITDLAVPFPPEITTPPMRLLIDARRSACLMASCPTTIDRGNGRPPTSIILVSLMPIEPWLFRASSASMAARARSSAEVSSAATFRTDKGARAIDPVPARLPVDTKVKPDVRGEATKAAAAARAACRRMPPLILAMVVNPTQGGVIMVQTGGGES